MTTYIDPTPHIWRISGDHLRALARAGHEMPSCLPHLATPGSLVLIKGRSSEVRESVSVVHDAATGRYHVGLGPSAAALARARPHLAGPVDGFEDAVSAVVHASVVVRQVYVRHTGGQPRGLWGIAHRHLQTTCIEHHRSESEVSA